MERDEHKAEEEITAPLILSLDDVIQQSIGRLNLTQILQTFLVSMPSFFDNQQTFISVFTHAQPTWHCTSNNSSSSSSSCTPTSNLCDLSKTDWTWDSGNVHTSIISEWDLQCASSIFAGMPATSYFTGCLLGGVVLATLGDSSFGRKNLLTISTLVMSLAAFASSFSPNIWVYSVFRFFCGAGRASIGTCALVLLTERVGKKSRPQATMIGFTCFSLGMLSLSGIAILTRGLSWRAMYLWTSIPGIICAILCHFCLYDSPRWLFMHGRGKDAMEVLRCLGDVSQIIPRLSNIETVQKVANTSTNPFISFMVILSRRWAVKRLLAIMFLAFGIGMMYFGMFLGVENLGYNIYLTLVFHSLLSLSSYVLFFLWWMQNCNRKTSLLGFCTISGALSIAMSLLGKDDNLMLIALELVSLFCACMAYNMVLMYMVELFPTCVRNSTSSLVRQSMILGSVFDPMLILVGRDNMIYSYGVFGLVMLLCGFLVLCLPETKGKVLYDTMEEQEFDSDNKLIL
ncbi:organic cation/carnitine transporter 3-like [Silene latifolia]|uniref:organic cation/carnitine transporter 3-like n=1 Tax=Silene latifolia TaxID=37657 RepID=UPI003D7845B6